MKKSDPRTKVVEQPFLLRLANGTDSVITALSVVVVISTVSMIFLALLLEVIVRYITQTSLGWAYEIPNILFPWFVMMGVVLAAQKGMHVSVELLSTFLTPLLNRALILLVNLLSVFMFLYLAWICPEIIETVSEETFPVTGLTSDWVYLSTPVGFIGLALTGVSNLIRLVYGENPLSLRKATGEPS